MKFSAKLVTALAAIALLVVAVAGVVSNASSAQADETSDATISLDKAWYNVTTATDEVTITVTDPDSDTQTVASTTVNYLASGLSGADLIQSFVLASNLGDGDDDDDVLTSADFTITDGNGPSAGSTSLDAILFVAVVDAGSGLVNIGIKAGHASSELVGGAVDQDIFISFFTDEIETLTNAVRVTSTQDSTGFLVSPIEATAASGGVFEITVDLVGATSTTNLFVVNGDTITVEFEAAVSSDKDQAKVETTGPTIDVISPADGFTTQDQTPTFIVQISDNESGVDADTITFTIGGTHTNVEPDDITTVGGVITAEFTANELVSDNSKGTVSWHVNVDDVAGNSSRTDVDDDDDQDSSTGSPDHQITIDQVAPDLANTGTQTGTFWDTSKDVFETGDTLPSGKSVGDDIDDKSSDTADDDVNAIVVVFDEDLDATTVDEADFTVGGITPISATVFDGAKTKVFIVMAGAFAPDAEPEVKVVGNISDTAGNNTAVGEVDAADGIAPTFTATLSASLTLDDVELVITANEPISGNVPTIKVSTPDGTDNGTEKSISSIKVTGNESWEVTIDVSDDVLADGLNAVVITGSDSNGNPASLGSFGSAKLEDADDEDDTLTFTVDTDLASPDFTPDDGDTGESPISDNSPFIQVSFAEEVTLTAATFQTGDGDEVDILAALNASTADNELYVLSPGSYPGGASTLALSEHTIKVSSIDAAGNESEDDEATFEIEERDDFELPLIAGWNLVSLPGAPSDPSINAVITVTDVGTVITFDPTVAGNFLTAVRDSSTGRLSGSLSTIDAQHGYWINTTSFNAIEVFIPPLPAATLPPTVPVFEGWNLISVVDTAGTSSAGDGLTGVATYLAGVDFSKVYRYAALTGTFSAISGTTTVTVGEGLWVFVNEDGTITP